MIIAFQFPQYLYECSEEFMLKKVCGTFFEIHRPFDKQVLFSQQEVTNKQANQLHFVTMTAQALCAGKYEVRRREADCLDLDHFADSER